MFSFLCSFCQLFGADMIDHKGIRGAAVSVFRANMFFLWFFAIPYPTVQRLSPLKICFRIYGLWCRRIRHHVMMSKWWVRIKVNMKRKMPTRAKKNERSNARDLNTLRVKKRSTSNVLMWEYIVWQHRTCQHQEVKFCSEGCIWYVCQRDQMKSFPSGIGGGKWNLE